MIWGPVTWSSVCRWRRPSEVMKGQPRMIANVNPYSIKQVGVTFGVRDAIKRRVPCSARPANICLLLCACVWVCVLRLGCFVCRPVFRINCVNRCLLASCVCVRLAPLSCQHVVRGLLLRVLTLVAVSLAFREAAFTGDSDVL